MTSPVSSPTVEILTIGREILDGRVVDTNSVWLGERLKEVGLIPRYAQRVDDEIGRVVEAFRIAESRSDVILVTGGLGPTADDLTAEAFAQFLGEPLELNAEALRQVEAVFAKLGRKMIEQQRKQAYFAPSCDILENHEGTAPGFALRKSRKSNNKRRWYFMPGVPKEMKAMFLGQILPELPKVADYRSSTWATQFTSEGELQNKLNGVHRKIVEKGDLSSSFEITYRTRFPENHVGLHGVCSSEEAKRLYAELAREIDGILGDSVFSGGADRDFQSLEKVVVDLLTRQGRVLGAVESCTGGLVAHRLTEVPGSSAAFWSSWVTYDNSSKIVLGVDPELIRTHGAVSSEVAQALAQAGLRQLEKMGAPHPICIATTGIAGPTGGSDLKPVGLCYVAITDGKQTHVEEVRGRPYLGRAEYKLLFSQKALNWVRLLLLESQPHHGIST
jgi:nicotinamide-nucleotide amidase